MAQIRTYESKEEFVKDFTSVLAKTGEDDITGEKMFKMTNQGVFEKLVSFFIKKKERLACTGDDSKAVTTWTSVLQSVVFWKRTND